MAKAQLKMADGTAVTIEGTPEEVAALVARVTGQPAAAKKRSGGRRRAPASGSSPSGHRAASSGPMDYIRELIDEDFFRSKRGIADVQKKLEEGAHIYPVTSLSPVLYRLVGKRELRRMKESGQWMYVNA